MGRKDQLLALHARLDGCKACPNMIGPVVHGPAVLSRIYLLGQAPGPHEGELKKPFAWTAGKTLFKWFESVGVEQEDFRRKVYISAVARCFPGKAKGGGDRKPDEEEIDACKTFIVEELEILRPELIIPVGGLAIEQVLGEYEPLADVVGTTRRAEFHGREVDVICLPHPSGASTWTKTEPGLTLTRKALKVLAAHPAWRSSFDEKKGAA